PLRMNGRELVLTIQRKSRSLFGGPTESFRPHFGHPCFKITRLFLYLVDSVFLLSRYELFVPLHELWKQYIIDLCNGLQPTTNPQLVQSKLLKADFHGAMIKVVRSKYASYVGLTGILIQEFKHVFKVITQKNELKVIPKRNSVFEIEVNGFVFERSAKKFKSKGTIDL
uniref:Ribonuclease P protein subunit p29 n=1 Tax=Neogobius melanostomus TaxID=47308 RepID=A0A8C6V314_9GOBI